MLIKVLFIVTTITSSNNHKKPKYEIVQPEKRIGISIKWTALQTLKLTVIEECLMYRRILKIY